MSRIFKIQEAPFTYGISEIGEELQRRPYPIYADEEGYVQKQDFWKGEVFKVVGFAPDKDAEEIQVLWKDAVADPAKALGLFLVTANDRFQWATHGTTVVECAPIAVA